MRAQLFNTWQKRLASIVIAALLSAAWFPAGIFATHQAPRFKLVYGTDCYMERGLFAGSDVSNEQICYSTQVNEAWLLLVIVASIAGVCMAIVLLRAIRWIRAAAMQDTSEAPPSKPTPLEFPEFRGDHNSSLMSHG